MLKILVVGLGSIGRRHLKCLQELGNVEVAALRTSKGTLKDASGIKEYYSIEESFNFEPDGVIIANPTSLHVETAVPYLEKGIPVLIEKPVAYAAEDSYELNKYSDLIRIAYCLRFHPLNKAIQVIIREEEIFKLSFKRSFYLPKWHPYADYRTEYTAKKELGGGVIRTLSHEIDLMIHWFGMPQSTVGVVDKVSDLEIDTDDYAFFSCKYSKGFRINFELDFFSPVNVNVAELFTAKGKYHWDLKQLWFTPYEQTEQELIQEFTAESVNLMYLDQIEDFIIFINSKTSANTTLKEAQQVLHIIEELDVR
jgi:predicted dehydrogenase